VSPIVGPSSSSTITFDDVIDEMRTRAPELTEARAVKLANWRLARMVANAGFKQKVSVLTTTVADQATYSVPSSVTDIRRAWIGTDRYDWASYDDIIELTGDRAWIDYADGKTGVVTLTDDSAGNPILYFYPAPDTADLDITVEQAFQSASMTYGGGSLTVLPTHIVPYWASGCYADAYEASARQDLAQFHEEEYREGTDLLRRFKNSRGGSGPRRIRLTR
jgi:hypothetical protein